MERDISAAGEIYILNFTSNLSFLNSRTCSLEFEYDASILCYDYFVCKCTSADIIKERVCMQAIAQVTFQI